MTNEMCSDPYQAVQAAFTRQSSTFDDADRANVILCDLRQQVYRHLNRHLLPGSCILELNAGTGIDAVHLAENGHTIHATDVSAGMIDELRKKIDCKGLSSAITCQQLSFEHIGGINNRIFNYVFSNFGGLNCAKDLSKVVSQLPQLLVPGAFVTLVMMPRFCPVEILGFLKGNGRKAFRRFVKGGADAHLEGEIFKTYYYSLSEIRKAFGKRFTLVESEGLAALSPQPHQSAFVASYPALYKALRVIDSFVNSFFPFNRWADHIIVTFQYCG